MSAVIRYERGYEDGCQGGYEGIIGVQVIFYHILSNKLI
jgi:hypothetical protein